LKNYEKRVLFKFTAIYFLSIAFFILLLGFLYFLQQKNIIIQKYTMSMSQYVLKLKQSSFTHIQNGYSFEIVESNKFKNKLALKENNVYKKVFPMHKGEQFVLVSVNSEIIDKELKEMKLIIIVSQILLLILFFTISIYLSRLSLKPINESISHLDRFIKDLVHDLNTPITSILLNSKMLKKQIKDESLLKKIARVENSANEIGSLYENLEVILKENLPKNRIDLENILQEKKEFYSIKYPNILINLNSMQKYINTNEKAIYRILDNILSNACKYSKENALVEIIFNDNTLIIKDNGKGMKYPERIFERSYSENENGHGIGMHIVQRLCDSLDIKIGVESKLNIGTTIQLKFY